MSQNLPNFFSHFGLSQMYSDFRWILVFNRWYLLNSVFNFVTQIRWFLLGYCCIHWLSRDHFKVVTWSLHWLLRDHFKAVTWSLQGCHVITSRLSRDHFKAVTWSLQVCHVITSRLSRDHFIGCHVITSRIKSEIKLNRLILSNFIQNCDSNIGLFSIAPPLVTLFQLCDSKVVALTRS